MPVHYNHPDRTTYFLDFGEILNDKGNGEVLAGLLANFMLANNIKTDHITGHYKVRENPREYQLESGLVTVLSQILQVPATTFYEYENGQESVLNGEPVAEGQHVVVVDGAVRTGGTIIRTATHLRDEYGATVEDAVVYMARPSGAKFDALQEDLDDHGITLYYMITAKQLLKDLLRQRSKTKAEFDEAMTDEDFNN